MEVKVPNRRLYDRCSTPPTTSSQAVQRNGDGSVSADVLANERSARCCAPRGVQIVRTLEGDAGTPRRKAATERDATRARWSCAGAASWP